MPIPNFIQIYDPVDCFSIIRDDEDPHRMSVKQYFDGLIVGTQTMSKDFRERLKPEFNLQNGDFFVISAPDIRARVYRQLRFVRATLFSLIPARPVQKRSVPVQNATDDMASGPGGTLI